MRIEFTYRNYKGETSDRNVEYEAVRSRKDGRPYFVGKNPEDGTFRSFLMERMENVRFVNP